MKEGTGPSDETALIRIHTQGHAERGLKMFLAERGQSMRKARFRWGVGRDISPVSCRRASMEFHCPSIASILRMFSACSTIRLLYESCEAFQLR